MCKWENVKTEILRFNSNVCSHFFIVLSFCKYEDMFEVEVTEKDKCVKQSEKNSCDYYTAKCRLIYSPKLKKQ